MVFAYPHSGNDDDDGEALFICRVICRVTPSANAVLPGGPDPDLMVKIGFFSLWNIGTAITLLHDNEVFHFKKMMKSLMKGKITKHSIKDSDLESLMERYETALEQLKTEVTSSKKQTRRMRR